MKIITVKEDIEYKKVDVANEIKSESQVNVAAEDTKVNQTVVESTNTDTVEWVESTKTIIEGTETSEDTYEVLDKKKIADPGKSTSLLLTRSMLLDSMNPVVLRGQLRTQENENPQPVATEGTTEEPSKAPAETDPNGRADADTGGNTNPDSSRDTDTGGDTNSNADTDAKRIAIGISFHLTVCESFRVTECISFSFTKRIAFSHHEQGRTGKEGHNHYPEVNRWQGDLC